MNWQPHEERHPNLGDFFNREAITNAMEFIKGVMLLLALVAMMAAVVVVG